MMSIFINGLRNDYIFYIPNDMKIRDLKQEYQEASPFGFFIYRGKKLDDNKRLCDYGIKKKDRIRYIDPGPTTHICPYGCGRQIPDDYKGCTELLQAKPNYFG